MRLVYQRKDLSFRGGKIMLRDGTKCVFDPKEFIKAFGYQQNPTIGQMFQNYDRYIRGDFSQLYADKTWVDIYYKLETSFDIRLEMMSPQDGPCVIRLSQVVMTGTIVANIMYDKFGMIPVSMLDPFNTKPNPIGTGSIWPFNTGEWLFGKIWTAYVHRDLDLFTRMIEDPFFEFTEKELNEFLDVSIKDEWSEATAIILRAIHDQGDSENNSTEILRL
jgi:hypothetical protein